MSERRGSVGRFVQTTDTSVAPRSRWQTVVTLQSSSGYLRLVEPSLQTRLPSSPTPAYTSLQGPTWQANQPFYDKPPWLQSLRRRVRLYPLNTLSSGLSINYSQELERKTISSGTEVRLWSRWWRPLTFYAEPRQRAWSVPCIHQTLLKPIILLGNHG